MVVDPTTPALPGEKNHLKSQNGECLCWTVVGNPREFEVNFFFDGDKVATAKTFFKLSFAQV